MKKPGESKKIGEKEIGKPTEIKPEEIIPGMEEKLEITKEGEKELQKAKGELKKLEELEKKRKAGGKKTEKGLEKELQKAREKVKAAFPEEKPKEEKEGFKPERRRIIEKEKKAKEIPEPGKPSAEMLETIKEVVEEKIPEEYKKFIGDLIGRDDEEAWRKREKIPVLKYSAMAFAGAASPESQQFVEENIENRPAWPWLPLALTGDNTKKGWELRNKIEFDEKFDKQGILKSKKVRGGKWWNLIEKVGLHKSKRFEKFVENVNSLTPWPGWFLAPRHILESTIGIRLDESPPKVELLKKYGESAPRSALESLRGDNSPEAKNLADEIYGKDKTHLGDPRLREVYDAYLKSIEKLPPHEKS